MRRSSRRRVIPRLSSSASSGTACLRVIPAASRNSLDREPVGLGWRAGRRRGRRRCRRRRRATTGRPARPGRRGGPAPAARTGSIPTGGSGASPPAASAADGGVIDERVGGVAPAGRRSRRPRRRRASSSSGAVAVVERRHVEPVGEAGLERRARGRGQDASGSTTQRPTSAGRALAGQPLQLVGVDPAPLGDDPLDGAVGAGLRRRPHRRDVEHLAAADGLVATRLAQHVAVARQQRQRRRRGAAARGRRRRARSRPDRARARAPACSPDADVGEVGAAARHVVVERRRARAARRRSARRCATGRATRRRRRAAARSWSTPARLRATRLPGPIASTARPERLDRRGPAPSRPRGSTRPLVAGRDRPAGQRAGDDGAAALGREHPVDPQPRPAAVASPPACVRDEVVERGGAARRARRRSARRPARSARRRGTCRPRGRRPPASPSSTQLVVDAGRPW